MICQQDSQFPALGWERFASRRFVGQLFNLNAVLHNTLGLSHYANLPLCNMVDDHSQLVIDVLLARQLKQNNCLLWVSGSERPDLGGKEADENTQCPKPKLYLCLGRSLVAPPPPPSQRLQILNDVWKVVTKVQNPDEYIEIAEVFVQYLLINFGVSQQANGSVVAAS